MHEIEDEKFAYENINQGKRKKRRSLRDFIFSFMHYIRHYQVILSTCCMKEILIQYAISLCTLIFQELFISTVK